MVESASGLSGAASPRKEKKFELDTPDIVAIGVLCLALAAAVTSVIVALGFVFGKASGSDSLKIISTCVGGSTVSGVVAALIGNKKSR